MFITLISRVESFFQLVGVLLIFVVVLFLTYLTTKWIAGYQKVHSYNQNLKLVETLKITSSKYVQIIQAGDEYLVIGVGKDEMILLTKLTQDQVKVVEQSSTEQLFQGESFKEIFEKLKKYKSKK